MILTDAIYLLSVTSDQYQTIYYGVLSLVFLGIILIMAYILIGKEKEDEE
ncbi:MAG: hypothetical protein ACTSRW_01080 [Candidatus Helarchaeota archaeon]